jgi:hypothetical protein
MSVLANKIKTSYYSHSILLVLQELKPFFSHFFKQSDTSKTSGFKTANGIAIRCFSKFDSFRVIAKRLQIVLLPSFPSAE